MEVVERQERQPASTEVTEVAPNILRMQLPISLPGLGHVNCYGLIDDKGIAVVDPGLPGPQSHKALVARLASAGFKLHDVHTVVVTHSHPDHFGGAGVLRERAGAEVVTHEAFRTFMDLMDEADDDQELEARVDKPPVRPWGAPTPWGGTAPGPPRGRRLRYRLMRIAGSRFMKAPRPSRRLADGHTIELAGREWVALHTPGHTLDHLCLFSPDDGVVLSGDHVLPTITPHISGLVGSADPLQTFFDSLDRMTTLEAVTQCLPAHGHPFTDLAGRSMAIKEHHDERLQAIRDVGIDVGEASVVEYSHRIFKERSWGAMAESETYAHLEHLRINGQMTSRRVGEELHFQPT